jgi:hypothetical protein
LITEAKKIIIKKTKNIFVGKMYRFTAFEMMIASSSEDEEDKELL